MSARILWFSAEWCGPCKKMKPVVERIESWSDAVEFERIDIDTEEGAARAKVFNVTGVPTFIRVHEDHPFLATHKVVGAQPPMKFKEMLGLPK